MPCLHLLQKKMFSGLILGLILISVSAQADTVDVSIQSFTFNPDSLSVPVGTTIRWTNLDGPAHTTTSDDGVWDSGSMSTNDQFSFTFDSAATYPYHCTFHPSMTATIVVFPLSVPSLTPYGLLVLALVVITSSVWVLRKKRAATGQR
jgi:plastocyanin